ncbi:putative GTP-binding protein EngB OS=Lysinibacillus sphaericus OX=1421 GN=engB PE=3 SV=1 [Lysinibacillus sphaericus]
MMYDFLKHYSIPCIVIATKADKIPKGKWDKHKKVVKETLDMDKNDPLIVFSSEKGIGFEEAWRTIENKM